MERRTSTYRLYEDLVWSCVVLRNGVLNHDNCHLSGLEGARGLHGRHLRSRSLAAEDGEDATGSPGARAGRRLTGDQSKNSRNPFMCALRTQNHLFLP